MRKRRCRSTPRFGGGSDSSDDTNIANTFDPMITTRRLTDVEVLIRRMLTNVHYIGRYHLRINRRETVKNYTFKY